MKMLNATLITEWQDSTALCVYEWENRVRPVDGREGSKFFTS